MIPKDEVTLITTCMNREKFLLQSYKTWLDYGFSNIVVVDWSSDVPLQKNEDLNKSVKIIRIDGQEKFDGSKARNVGSEFVTTKYVMFIDSDIRIVRDLNISNVENCFFRGGLPSDVNSSGTFFVEFSHFKKVKGFNETLSGWGYEDIDLYSRFMDIGLRERVFAIDSLIHIHHEDVLRTKYRNKEGESMDESLKRNVNISNKSRPKSPYYLSLNTCAIKIEG
jgi:glycosyltransferase involved in cell wall biosynthesis